MRNAVTTLVSLLMVVVVLAACRSTADPPVVGVITRSILQSTVTPTWTAGAATLPATTSGRSASAVQATTIPTSTTTPRPTTGPPTPPPPTPTPNYPLYGGKPLQRSDFGVQIHLHREDVSAIMQHLRRLDAGWVKVQVSWKLFQPEPERFDEFLFGELDHLVSAAADNDLRVLLSVAKAPEWSRPTTELDGPPLDNDHFRSFMTLLAGRYQGRVAAYELWNEPNLQREWNGSPLGGAALVDLIAAGASGVSSGDPAALVISGAPAPTGINDGLTAVDDRLFFQQMVAAGVTELVDAVGVHPYGWANPPDGSAADESQVAPSHNNHPSFFFADTLRDYRGILDRAGKSDVPLWATEFGWGTFDGLGVPPPTGLEYMTSISEWQQALYTMRAYEMAADNDKIGPLFLWNLNFGPTLGLDYAEAGYSLLRPDGTPRPVYGSFSSIPKQP